MPYFSFVFFFTFFASKAHEKKVEKRKSLADAQTPVKCSFIQKQERKIK